MAQHTVEVREPTKAARRVTISGEVVVGRDADDLLLDDEKASRRHVLLRSLGDTLTATDLGSRNGTSVNDVRISGETRLYAGDRLRIGQSELFVVEGSERSGAASRAASGLECLDGDAAAVFYRRGSPGERLARSVAARARRARRALAGLGSDLAAAPRIYLVDPFPDPERPGEIVTGGAVVDATRNEVWVVVTAEAPPDPIERPLALLAGAQLPAAQDLEALLEGYGLHLAESPDPDPQLAEVALPPLDSADGALRAAMALSFVRFLLERGNEADLRRLFTSAAPGRVDEAAHEIYGTSLVALEDQWHQRVTAGERRVPVGQFLRLAIRYVRPYWVRQAEIFGYMLLGLAFTVVFPFVSRRLFDEALPSGRFSEVVELLTLLAAALGVSLLAGLRQAYLTAYVSGSVVRQVRSDMFGRLQVLPSGWFHRHQQGDVLSRLFSDVGLLESGLSQTMSEGVFQMLSLVVSAVVLLTLQPLLAAVVILGAPLVALVYRVMGPGAQKRSLALQERMGAVHQVATENYAAQPVVKAFGLEERERSRFRRASDRLFQRLVSLELYGGIFGLSVEVIVTALRLGVMGLGAWLILENRLTIGGLVAFLGLMGEVVAPVTVLTNIGQRIQASTGALLRINEVLDATPEASESGAVDLPPLRDEIRLEGVTFSYTPDRQTLTDVNLTIPAGQRVALVGASGSGKSTILQLLMRFYDPDQGSVLFDGHDIRHASLASLRGQLGVVFQDTFLFDGTIRENIAVGRPGASDDEVEAAARAAELHDFVAGLPRGYDTLVGERGGRLSGGQRQRMAIARALIRDPRVLVLDEATSALDPRTERLIADTLDRVSAGRTTIAVTHRLTSVTDYDLICVLHDGKVVEQGRHADLVEAGGQYASLWQEQTGEGAAAAEFEVNAALARIPLFADLSDHELASVAAELRPTSLRPGERMDEELGLAIVRSGRGRVLTPDLEGRLVPAAELSPGEAFGVARAMGSAIGSALEAAGDLNLLVLDAVSFADLATRLPPLADRLAGHRVAGPTRGRRLERMTVAVDAPAERSAREANPATQEVRRLSGTFATARRR